MPRGRGLGTKTRGDRFAPRSHVALSAHVVRRHARRWTGAFLECSKKNVIIKNMENQRTISIICLSKTEWVGKSNNIQDLIPRSLEKYGPSFYTHPRKDMGGSKVPRDDSCKWRYGCALSRFDDRLSLHSLINPTGIIPLLKQSTYYCNITVYFNILDILTNMN